MYWGGGENTDNIKKFAHATAWYGTRSSPSHVYLMAYLVYHLHQEFIMRRGREYRTRYIPYLRRVTWLPTLRTWLNQGAKYSIFLRTVKSRGIFREFYARILMNACCIAIYWRFQSLSRLHSLALEATPIINNLNRALSLVNVWIPGAWLSENILLGPYSAFDTLFLIRPGKLHL